ncbi:hypothetical protein WJX72_008196 [[Myrmecia] bisecta]|uniref:Quinolinate synthase, chloroplastic n=1 Tax=[Myrmecia] bisecta TaxID=41462 RepID=A0AAW1Q1E6_9CHLO
MYTSRVAAVHFNPVRLGRTSSSGRGLGGICLRSPARAPPTARTTRALTVQVAATATTERAAVATPVAPAAQVKLPTVVFERLVEAFQGAADTKARLALLRDLAKQLRPLPQEARTAANRVMGCTAQVWVTAELDRDGKVQVDADSDSELTRGLCAVLVNGLSGLTPAELLEVQPSVLGALELGPAVLTPSRNNGFLNMLESIRKRTQMLTEQLPRFPSLVVAANSVSAQGPFAEAQVKYLQPDAGEVDALVKVLSEKKIGIVAHFYMDPEVQGVLSSAAARWPHIHISDSLVMADASVKMAEAGCTAVAVLGVDFMSENVRAILDEAGHQDVKVYRMAAEDIGCSLAEAAESSSYARYLSQAAAIPQPALHVVYINTSLRTKAHAHATVPTITCTSSNVVQTVLQAFAQVANLTVWYGPDTYMGRNLVQLFRSLAELSDEEVAKLHPAHSRASIRSLLPRLHYFEEGTCIVHHIFGGEVTELVRKGYGDAYLTAHFEVPGEMFSLAMEAKTRDMGVVGSTQNILDFIAGKVATALEQPFPDRLQVVLGTESGMITSIVRKVQAMLQASGRVDVDVEIVFPVSPEAITTSGQSPSMTGSGPVILPGGLQVVPGAASGEGCSTEGGCASCPYMKMNSLRALMGVCQKFGTPGETLLEAFRPRAYQETVNGRSMAQAGCQPILHMRAFQTGKRLPDALVDDILMRNASA